MFICNIIINSIFVNSNKKYYPQIFLEECKYAIKDKTISNERLCFKKCL